MPVLAPNPEQYELDRLEAIEEADREERRRTAEREHEYRLAKLKYSTAGRFRMWGRVLIAFAKAPAWFVLAITSRRSLEMPDHWKKFLEI